MDCYFEKNERIGEYVWRKLSMQGVWSIHIVQIGFVQGYCASRSGEMESGRSRLLN